jgi:hypothetical protein
MANSNTTALASIPFRIIDSDGPQSFTASKPGAFDVYFATFTVAVPEPTSLAAVGLIGLGLARRRRA